MIAPSSLFTDHLPHGDGLVATGFVQELARRGHELHVAAGPVALKSDLPNNVHIYSLADAPPATASARLRFMGALRRLYGRLARSGRFDLVHQLNPVEAGVSLSLVGSGTPIVLGPYIPEWAPSGPLAQRVKRLVRGAQQRGASVLLLTTPAAASMLAPGVSQARVHELPHGIDDRVWRPAGARSGQTVLFLSNLEARKGIHVLLDAFEEVATRLPAARLVIGGDGSERDAVESRLRQAPDRSRVELLGRVDRDGVLALMQASDVYCLPSYGEPFGMGALEAMACGLPVVATAAGGLRHLVPDDGGRKVPTGDPGALARALDEVLGDRSLRGAMGARNRAVVEARFAWSRVGDRLEELYADALGVGGAL